MLSGEYATQFVRGYQEAPESPDTLMVGATCKHFVANSMEKSSDDGITHGREDFNAIVTPQDMVDSYLAPFQSCVERGRAAGLMCR
jgi:beta-glucosidase-like glycosyl hydrolase